MNDKDFKILMEIAEDLRKTPFTKEQALQSFVRAGILDEHGKLTQPYIDLLNAD